MEEKMKPLVTAIMPTLNRREDIRETLSMLKNQIYSPMEVIVVDNASTDGTSEMVRREFPYVTLISLHKNAGNICGRNIAMKNARGKYILCLDDDSFPGRNVVSRIVEEFERDPQLGLIACGVLDTQKFGSSEKFERDLGRDAFGWIGCGGAFRRDLFEQVGYWEEWGIVGGAWEISLSARIKNAGYRIKSFRDIYVYHQWSQNGDPAKNRLSDQRMFDGCRVPPVFYSKYYPIDLLLSGLWRWSWAVAQATISQKRFMYLKAYMSVLIKIPIAWRSRRALERSVAKMARLTFKFKGK